MIMPYQFLKDNDQNMFYLVEKKNSFWWISEIISNSKMFLTLFSTINETLLIIRGTDGNLRQIM